MSFAQLCIPIRLLTANVRDRFRNYVARIIAWLENRKLKKPNILFGLLKQQFVPFLAEASARSIQILISALNLVELKIHNFLRARVKQMFFC